ncbi:MFS transporter [Amycolatopsis sp. NPDC023774]|uniref:MFS transporter n=1 Tax=Amycolatopsis sp. NPDC023774 TaxID=3155015 RepID=UPI003402F685
MTSARPRSAQQAPPVGSSSTGYVTFVVLLSFLAWALVSMDNVMLGVAVPALAPALHLSLSTIEYLIGAFSFVTFAAPVLAGRLIDRIGRRANFQLSLVGTGIFGGLTALVANAWQFIVVRLLVSTSYGLTEPVINTLVAEEAPRHRRGVLMGLVQAGYPLGAGVAGTIAAVLLPAYGWRPLFYLAFAPLLLVLVAGWFLRDSARFKQVKAATTHRAVEHKPGWRKLFTPEQAVAVDMVHLGRAEGVAERDPVSRTRRAKTCVNPPRRLSAPAPGTQAGKARAPQRRRAPVR